MCSIFPACARCSRQLRSRAVRVVNVDTAKASPFAQSLLFNWIAAYMYEGDAPLAERRAAALSLDRDLLRDLLGAEELRELLDPGVLADVELELQCVADGRRARSADELHDVLRKVGDLTAAEVDLRCEGAAGEWIDELTRTRRAIEIQLGGESRFDRRRRRCPISRRVRMQRSARPAAGVHRTCAHPLESLVARYAAHPRPVHRRPTWPVASRRRSSGSSARSPRSRQTIAWCTASSVPAAWAASTATPTCCASCGGGRWRCCGARSSRSSPRPTPGSSRHGTASPASVAASIRWSRRLAQLQGAALVASALESELLPARLRSYRAADLDELCTTRRCRLGRQWCDRPQRRQDPAVLRRPVRALDASLEARRAARRSAARRDPRPPGVARRQLLEPVACRLSATQPMPSCSPRCGIWSGRARSPTTRSLRCGRCCRAASASRSSAAPRGRPRPGRLTRIGPPAGAGRWSLVAPQRCPAPSPTQAAHAAALQLLERYGVVTREAVLAEGVKGGYAATYGVLKVLEERGQVRRGYFVSGLGAAQFALAGCGRPLAVRSRGRRPRAASRAGPRPGGPVGH